MFIYILHEFVLSFSKSQTIQKRINANEMQRPVINYLFVLIIFAFHSGKQFVLRT